MNLRFEYDYLSVAVAELKKAIRWRDIAREGRPANSTAAEAFTKGARSIMRHHALRSRHAFNGELLSAN